MQANARNLDTYLCLDDFENAARHHLPRPLFGYVSGASETGASLRHNRGDFADYAFWPRVLRDVSQRSTQTTIFGESYSAPFGIAPMGISALMLTVVILFSLRGQARREYR